jgi:hypothetical protein
MNAAALILSDAFETRDEWEVLLSSVLPGAHVVLVEEGLFLRSLQARRAGFHLRDTIACLYPGDRSKLAYLFRAPMSEKSLTDNILRHGTGGLHIDACRVQTSDKLGGGAEKRCTFEDSEGWSRPWMKDPEAQAAYAARAQAAVARAEQLGRWPANLLLVHDPSCGPSCAPLCPAARIGVQSGRRPATLTGRADGPQENPATARPDAFFGNLKGGIGVVYADDGDASRYFPQFRNEEELFSWLERLVTPEGKACLRL